MRIWKVDEIPRRGKRRTPIYQRVNNPTIPEHHTALNLAGWTWPLAGTRKPLDTEEMISRAFSTASRRS